MTTGFAGAGRETLRLVAGDRPDFGTETWVPRAFGDELVRWPPRRDGSDGELAGVVRVNWLHLTCQSPVWLRRLVADPVARLTVQRATVIVASWRRPYRGWSGRLGPLPGLVRHEMRLPPRGRGTALVDVTLAEGAPLVQILSAVLEALAVRRAHPAMVSAAVEVSGDTLPAWLDPHLVRFWTPSGADDETGDPPDIIIANAETPDGTGSTPGGGPADRCVTVQADPFGIRTADGSRRILVDAAVHNPVGRRVVDPGRRARLWFGTSGAASPSGGRWFVEADVDGDYVASSGPLDGSLPGDEALRVLRGADVMECRFGGSADPAGEAALLVQLSSAGVICHADRLAAPVADLVSVELRDAVQAPLPDDLSGGIAWELRSVRQRRAALRGHAAALWLGGVPGRPSSDAPRLPAVSAVLVTRRPDLVAHAVSMAAAQTYPALELILGTHGFRLSDHQRALVRDCGRPVEVVEIPPELTLGEALGVASTRASGDLVTKMDDDDLYGREHVWDLVLAYLFSGASVVGKGSEFVFIEALGITVRRSTMGREAYSSVVAGGTICISRADLVAIGGWRPVPEGVDRALLDRVLQRGGLIYRTHPFGFVYCRHSRGHTWDPGTEYFLRNSGQQWTDIPRFLPPAEAADEDRNYAVRAG